jgi:adenylate cyclase
VEFFFGEHVFDVARRELRRGAELIAIEPQVCDLLIFLIKNRDRVVSKDDILDAIWGGRIVSESALTTRINAVRKAVGDSGAAQQVIRTLPRKGVRFIADVSEEKPVMLAVELALAETLPSAMPALADRPSIAVLPFTNMSGDAEHQYFADGMVEQIITALIRIRWLSVIARNSSSAHQVEVVDVKQVGRELGVRYILEGSVRRSGSRLRISAHLVETVAGAHLWADHFDGSLDDVFELQDKIAVSVAGVIEPTLQVAEIRRAADRPTSDLTAYDLYLRALSHSHSWEKARIVQALDLLDQAIERDPDYGPALGLAARCHFDLHVNGWSDSPEESQRRGVELARQALQVAGTDPNVLQRAAFALGYFGADLDPAVELIDRALALNPSFAEGWVISGWLRLWAGKIELGISLFEASLRLSPHARRAGALMAIGVGHFFAGRFEDAEAMLLRSLQEHPRWAPTFRFLASCYAHMGRLDEARDAVERLRAVTPLVVPKATHWRDPEHRERFLSGLRIAAEEAR